MSLVALYPWLLAAGLIALVVTLFRLDRRISRGPLDAGARDQLPIEPPGQTTTPWEIQSLDRQLQDPKRRPEAIALIRRLVVETGLGNDPTLQLDDNASLDAIEAVICRLELNLALDSTDIDHQ